MLLIYYLFLLLFSISAEKSTVSTLFDHFDLTKEARWCFFSHAYVFATSLRTSIFFVCFVYIYLDNNADV
jgi:hypothetical protein